MTDRVIEFSGPASEWLEALPLGNGRIGAMCWGGHPARIDLNEETVWSGNPGRESAQRRRGEQCAAKLIANARAAISGGRAEDAAEALRGAQAGHVQAFLPVGTLTVDPGRLAAPPVARRLSLADAVHTSVCADLISETFVSAPHDVLVHRISGLAPETVPTVGFASPLREESREEDGAVVVSTLRSPVDVAPAHEPQLPAAVWPDEDEQSVTAVVRIESRRTDADVLVVVAIETTYPGMGETRFGTVAEARRRAEEKARAAFAASYADLRASHIAAHADLFGRVELTAGEPAPPHGTASRLVRARDAAGPTACADTDLVPLLFDYGRYLLIASSRSPGCLPATLQGLWNADMRPPWSSAYTLNINTQMNYWPAEPTNLSEVVEPLFRLVGALARTGGTTARELGAGGWAAHHNSDAWGHSAAVGEGRGDPSWAFWPMAGPWLVRHLAEHSAFGASTDRAAAVADRLRRGAAEFVLDWLIEDDAGRLGTAPSTSPENTYVEASGRIASVGRTSTMDLALVRELLESIGDDPGDLGDRARTALARLPEISERVTPDGVLEWDRPVSETDPHHRHLSHLYPLFPGATADAAFERAAAVSLDRRGADSTGWSLAWKMALWSRLGRADRVDELIELFLRDARSHGGEWAGGLYPNLFAAHPPFQVDGNLGFTAGIAESLLQSHRGAIELLPAVPTALRTGSVRGLVARPGVIVDMVWESGELVSAVLRARPGNDASVIVRWRDREVEAAVSAACPITVTPASMRVRAHVDI